MQDIAFSNSCFIGYDHKNSGNINTNIKKDIFSYVNVSCGVKLVYRYTVKYNSGGHAGHACSNKNLIN